MNVVMAELRTVCWHVARAAAETAAPATRGQRTETAVVLPASATVNVSFLWRASERRAAAPGVTITVFVRPARTVTVRLTRILLERRTMSLPVQDRVALAQPTVIGKRPFLSAFRLRCSSVKWRMSPSEVEAGVLAGGVVTGAGSGAAGAIAGSSTPG